jgi:uncharacterized protein (TIGR03085 family)
MTRLAQTERTALCDTALQVGADQPTLCGEWDVKDLVCHLTLRETSPAAVGIVVSPLAWAAEAQMRRLRKRDLAVLVEKLRGGPPHWSPYAVPKLDAAINTLEYFVHHEDIRRAQPAWTARTLSGDDEKLLWSLVRTAGKGLVRGAPVGVTIENLTTGSRADLKKGATPADVVTVRGLPSEVALFVFGRRDHADVELLGEPGAVARLRATSLGL